MASATPHTIVLESNNPDNMLQRVIERYIAYTGSTIVPGDLVEINTTGQAQEHSVTAGHDYGLVAIENPFDNALTTAAIDQPYAVGDTVRMIRALPGDVLYMWLASGEATSIGSPLAASSVAGQLATETGATGPVPDPIFGFATEAVTGVTGGSRVRVRKS